MAKLLVVDDSLPERMFIGGILKREEGWSIEYAEHGQDALDKIAANPPDLVVTDMMMPVMDGLELVTAIKENHALIPVILVTSQGSEEVAVKALQLGAASYAPKQRLNHILVETVESVLALSAERKTESRLLSCLVESETNFEINNDATLIPPLVGYMLDEGAKAGLISEMDRVRIGVALDEALVNALFHGNLELSSELRDSDQPKYRALINERLQCEPYCARTVNASVRISPEQVEFHIVDHGPGFDPDTLPDPTDPANLDKLGGRGVMLMRTFMDEVNYNPTGNAVTMIKHKSETDG